jgi:dolichol-phosphate mannosyltransferase
VTVVVPTRNERDNVEELVRRLGALLRRPGVSVLFVDDSCDATPDVIAALAPALPVRLLHRGPEQRVGGLSGAVVAGLRAAGTDHVVVMDGDLQHPPELAAVLYERALQTGADVVVASRYTGAGDSSGLDGATRRLVSSASTVLCKAVFPIRLRACSDPMTGFFCVRLAAVDLDVLRPTGFKILLEVLVRRRRPLSVVEEPFVFAERPAGTSKTSLRQGLLFLAQVTRLRLARIDLVAA